MNDINRIKFLEESHRVLDRQIQLLESSRTASEDVSYFKKKKLILKDELNRLRREQYEDSQTVTFEDDQ